MLELKRKVWGEVDKLVGTDTILGTSTSCIGNFPPLFHLLIFVCCSSKQDLGFHGAQGSVYSGTPLQPSLSHTYGRARPSTMDKHRGAYQSLYCISLFLFPYFFNSFFQVRAGARALMAEVGQGPVSLSREVPGFVLNRMQVCEKLYFEYFEVCEKLNNS